MSKKIKFLLSLALLVLVVGGVGYYLFYDSTPVVTQPNYFEWKIVSENLTPEQQQKFTERFEEAKAALEINMDDFQAWILLGSAKKQVGDFKGAEEAWVYAGEIRPFNSLSFNNLADLYTKYLVNYDKAEAAYFKAVENSTGEDINRDHYRAFFDFYMYYVKDSSKAEKIILEAIEKNPKASDLYALAASFYEQRGDIAKAIEYYQKTLDLNPANEGAKRKLLELKA